MKVFWSLTNEASINEMKTRRSSFCKFFVPTTESGKERCLWLCFLLLFFTTSNHRILSNDISYLSPCSYDSSKIYKKFQKVVSVRKKLLEYLDRGFVHKFVSKYQQTFLNTKQLEFLDPCLMHKFVSEYTKKSV